MEDKNTIKMGFKDRLKGRYPDVTMDSDDEFESVASRYADEMEGEIGKYKTAEEQMVELCKIEPEFAGVVNDMVTNKMSFRAALAKYFDQNDLIPQDGDDDYEAYSKLRDERMLNLKKRESLDQEIDANWNESENAIASFLQEKGMSEQEGERFIDQVDEVFKNLIYKKITPEMLEGFFKMLSFDSAVKDAENLGETRGRNANIEAKRKIEKAKETGDGLPDTTGGGSVNVDRKVRQKNPFGMKERPRI